MQRTLRSPLDPERRASLTILVAARWLLVVAALIAQDYAPDNPPVALTGINILIAGAALANLWIYWRLRRHLPVATGAAAAVSVFDAAAITTAVGLVDGFANSAYILYYPALLAFSLVFPGTAGVVYSALTGLAYVLVCFSTNTQNFDGGAAHDQKVMLLRLATMAASVLIANLIVRSERDRRLAAVAAEAERTEEVLALERRALEMEVATQAERTRLSEEVHDGISQSVYMLTLGLETVAALAERDPSDARLPERLDALLNLSKGTLLETRNLLFDLGGVMAGQTSLAGLVRHHAQEFAAVTAIPVEVHVEGDERLLPPATVSEVYRVLQEGLANVYKHAGAASASLTLRYGRDALMLRVEDTGRGFDPQSTRARGSGLKNMQRRAGRLGGALTIEPGVECGTVLTVTIPYQGQSHGADPGDAG